MKRVQIVLMITILVCILVPGSVFANSQTYPDVINSLGFDDIQPLMMDRNVTVTYLTDFVDTAAAYYAGVTDLSVEQTVDTLIAAMENAYITYNSLTQQLNTLQANKKLLEKSLAAAKVQYQLGMITQNSLTNTQNQLDSLNSTIDQLTESQKSIVKQLNLSIGQGYDTYLVLKDVPDVTAEKIAAIKVDEDYKNAVDNSLSVRAKDDSDLKDDAKRSFKNDFYNAYQNILDKQKAAEIEKTKLATAEENIKFAEIKSNLGLLSLLGLASEWSSFTGQQAASKTAEYELFRAYRNYQWAKMGLIVSGTSSSASTAASASLSAS